MSRVSRALGRATSALLVGSITACGAAVPRPRGEPDPTVASSARAAPWPPRLGTVVHRVEEQGIDYSAVATMRFELTLHPDGTGSALRTTRGVDVAGSDAHETDASVRYAASARPDGERFAVTLTPQAGSPPTAESVELVCEPWSPDARAESSDVATPSLPGVEWLCALPPERVFALDRAALQHVPREGVFLLLGTTRDAAVRERVDGSGREVTTRAAELTPPTAAEDDP